MATHQAGDLRAPALAAAELGAPHGAASEATPYRLQAQCVAVGRLGPIYRALETTTGRVVTVERIGIVTDRDAPSQAGGEAVEHVRTVLQRELDELRGKLPGVLWYDLVVRDGHGQGRPDLLLVLRENAGQTLAQLCKEFGRLHPLAVRQYVHALVRSVATMHEHGLYCGGLSLSTVFVGADHSLRIGACFPSFSTVQHIEQSGILVDGSICRTTLQRPLTGQEVAQDVRSVAYVMAELLTGQRARGAFLLDLSRLVDSVGPGGQQHVTFLRELLTTERLTGELCQHPFLPTQSALTSIHSDDERSSQCAISTDEDASGDAVLGTSPALQEQRRMIVALTRDELAKCQAQTREATQQMRAWFRSFERQYGRKPTASDRPPTVVRLQARSRVLADRVATLNARLDTVCKSFHRAAATEETAPSATPSPNPVEALQAPIEIEIPPLDDAQATQDRSGTRRSPAQNAFLNRHLKSSDAVVTN